MIGAAGIAPSTSLVCMPSSGAGVRKAEIQKNGIAKGLALLG